MEEGKKNLSANVLKGIGYLLPFVVSAVLILFWGKTWAFLFGLVGVAAIFIQWKFILPLVLMIAFSIASVVICVVEAALKGLYLLTTLDFFNKADFALNFVRASIWEKLVKITENDAFEILE